MRASATVFYFKYYVGDDGTPIILIFDKTAVFLSLSTFALVGGVMMTHLVSFQTRLRVLRLWLAYD
jgi:GPH family glycoside/pentoside/hexuronide:cation symporter